MASTHDDALEYLGGRLPLLAPSQMSSHQRELYERILASRVVAAEQAGYTAALADGRLIGPFNALVRLPDVGAGMLGWTGAIGRSLHELGIGAVVRETVVLTVAASRGADYAVYAHTAAARRAGLDAAAVAAITARRAPDHLPPDAALAHRLARILAEGAPVDEDTYAEAVAIFGVDGVVALVSLVGQYLTTCAVLACFDVPAPRTG